LDLHTAETGARSYAAHSSFAAH